MRQWRLWLWVAASGAVLAGSLMAGLLWFFQSSCRWHKELANPSLEVEVIQAAMGNEVVEAAQGIKTERIGSTILQLQSFGERSSWENQMAAAEYILQELQAMGLQPVIQEYRHEERVFRNVVVSFPGQVQPDKVLMAVAHYDSKNWVRGEACPGADDNASGVSALLELARILPDLGRQSTWQLVFFSNEERGRQGSRDFAQRARGDGTHIAGLLAVDVVGYRPHGFSDLFRLIGSSLGTERKIKGAAKVFLNGYHTLRNGCAPLQMAFRAEELSIAPPAPVREAMGGAIFWQLGGACP